MIILREYNVSRDGHWLTIDVILNPSLTGIKFKSLRVSCTGAFTSADTSANTFDTIIAEAINEYTGNHVDFATDTEIRLKLDASIGNKPFYLQLIAEDPEGSATTCAYKSVLLSVTFNKYPLYKAIECAAHSLNGCNVPQQFIDFLFHLKALEASMAIGDKDSINMYYDWLVLHGNSGFNCGSNHSTPVSHGCGCRH